VASYGRQLGFITEVLLSQASPSTIAPDKAARSLAQLEGVYREVEDVKRRNCNKLAHSAVTVLEKLQASDPAELSGVLGRYSQPTPLLKHQRQASAQARRLTAPARARRPTGPGIDPRQRIPRAMAYLETSAPAAAFLHGNGDDPTAGTGDSA